LFEYNTVDELLTVSNCSLITNNNINITNNSITESITNNFTQTFIEGDYNWSVNCSDALNSINNSEGRSFRVDLTFPTIPNSSANMTQINITNYICLNITTTDALSGVNTTYATIVTPDDIIDTVVFNDTGTGTCGDAAGNDVYWAQYQPNNIGIYNWTFTFANDSAGNLNSTLVAILFNSSSIATLTVNMTAPSANFEINESEPEFNYTYRQECRAICNGNNGAENCTDVSLYAQYNLSGGVADITTTSQFLVNYNDSFFCGGVLSILIVLFSVELKFPAESLIHT